MADEERGTDGPSLELPSLSFGRRRRKKAAAQAAPEPPAPPAPEPESEPEPRRTPTRSPAPELPEPTPPPLFADEVVAPAAEPEPEAPAPVPVTPAPMTPGASTPTPTAQKRPAKKQGRRRGFTLPALGGTPAAVVTGILVGAITVGVTWASLGACEAVRGTSSCGGPGYLLLLGILIAMILLGATLLRAWGVPDPGSTSTLAVGLLAVLVMLFLVGVLFHWWMILVIPACSALTFAAAHWVASTFVTDG